LLKFSQYERADKKADKTSSPLPGGGYLASHITANEVETLGLRFFVAKYIIASKISI
jgi:hypothetical protein